VALDTFARDQQVGLGALAWLSGPGDEDLPEPAAWDPPWDPRESGDRDPPLAPPWTASGLTRRTPSAVLLSTRNLPIGMHEG